MPAAQEPLEGWRGGNSSPSNIFDTCLLAAMLTPGGAAVEIRWEWRQGGEHASGGGPWLGCQRVGEHHAWEK